MRALTRAALLLALGAGTASAQAPFTRSAAGGAHVQSYQFADGVGAESARLVLFPIALQQQVGSALFEFYSAYGRGTVRLDGRTYEMASFTDTWMRTTLSPFAGTAVTLGLNLPTGQATHDNEEAVVATVLSTDLLGFREASWGTGFGGTLGVSTARTVGAWSVTAGASYRRSGEFEPRADTSVVYLPGDERRARVAMERPVGGTGRLSLGAMALNYTEDKLDGRNLFRAGLRTMMDASYTRQAGSGEWTVFAANIWRAKGDVRLPIVSQASTVTRDSVFQTGAQNLTMVGVSGSARVAGGFVLRPSTDFRYQTGHDVGGQGWMLGGGLDVPLAVGHFELFPSVRGLYGAIENRERAMRNVWGLESSMVVRWGQRS